MHPLRTPRSCGTHDGLFHSDEVTACGLLLLFDLIDRDKIVRTRDEGLLSKCTFVCDVGGIYDPNQKLFDHHQASYDGDLSSAGMVLLYLRDQGILNPIDYQFFHDTLILGIDLDDNGRITEQVGHCSFSDVILNFAPIHCDASTEELNAAFQAALDFALGHLTRAWERHKYTASCSEIVAQVMQSKDVCLIFERNIPWLESFFELEGRHHPAQFILMPAGDHWKLRGIPPSYEERMQVRWPLPRSWAGLIGPALKKTTGIPGAIFCHKGRFISIWETRQDAEKALAYILAHPDERG